MRDYELGIRAKRNKTFADRSLSAKNKDFNVRLHHFSDMGARETGQERTF